MTRLLFTPLLAMMLAAPAALALDPSCVPMIDAATKVFTIPVHIYTSSTSAYPGEKVRSSELVFVNHSSYLMVNGKWHASPVTEQTIQDARKEAQGKDATVACRLLREEPVNGEGAILYSSHSETPDGKVETQLWISKTRGLPLKQEIDIDVGGKFGKSHRILRYDYTNVQAPTVVP